MLVNAGFYILYYHGLISETMGLKEFTRDDPIFVNEAVLRDNYRPEELVERDAELSEYQEALRPVINAAPPKNIFLYGQTGVGKTLATRLVLNQLLSDQENYDDLNIEVVNLNCKSASSSYQVSVDLVNQFRDTTEKIPSTGYASSQVYQMLWNHINDLDATHLLVVLDEIDSIGNDDDILYELPRANDNESVDDTLVGVIGISNDFTFRDNLSARVKDSLCDEEIHFPPYDANQLRNILKQRATNAFRDGVLDGDTIPLCSAFSAQESGSATTGTKTAVQSRGSGAYTGRFGGRRKRRSRGSRFDRERKSAGRARILTDTKSVDVVQFTPT